MAITCFECLDICTLMERRPSTSTHPMAMAQTTAATSSSANPCDNRPLPAREQNRVKLWITLIGGRRVQPKKSDFVIHKNMPLRSPTIRWQQQQQHTQMIYNGRSTNQKSHTTDFNTFIVHTEQQQHIGVAIDRQIDSQQQKDSKWFYLLFGFCTICVCAVQRRGSPFCQWCDGVGGNTKWKSKLHV